MRVGKERRDGWLDPRDLRVGSRWGEIAWGGVGRDGEMWVMGYAIPFPVPPTMEFTSLRTVRSRAIFVMREDVRYGDAVPAAVYSNVLY